jgi:DNA-binding transcriptional ArsR family regulator
MLHHSTVDRMFHALGDPCRRDMIEALAERPRTISDLATRAGISLSGAAQHLKILEASGLASSEKLGRSRTCRLVPEGLAALDTWVAARRAMLVRRLDRLEAHLAKGERP